MKAHKILAGVTIAFALAVGATGAVGAHWNDDWFDPGVRPGMMDPGMGMHPEDGWHQPDMGMGSDSGWHNPGVGMYPPHW